MKIEGRSTAFETRRPHSSVFAIESTTADNILIWSDVREAMIIDGKVAVIVGGAGGIGKASCRALLQKGAKVCCADLTEESSIADLRKDFNDKQLIFVRCDSTKDEDVKKLFEKTTEHFGKLPEIVLTTVAILDEFNWQRCVDINISASIRLVNASLSAMGLNNGGNGGSVVLTSSVSGLQPENWGPVYCATKHAIIGLTRSWAEEMNFRDHGIRFNALCPAAVDTPFLSQIQKTYYSQLHQQRLDELPKLAPDTVADAFIRLTEDDSLNGALIHITTTNPFKIHTVAKLDT